MGVAKPVPAFDSQCGARTGIAKHVLAFNRSSYIKLVLCLFELRYYGSKFQTNPLIIRTPPSFWEKLLIIVFHIIRTPELKLFNFGRIIRVITVTE